MDRIAIGGGRFEVFDRRRKERATIPTVTVRNGGSSKPFAFNDQSFAAMGEPEAVVVLWDPDAKCIGFRPAPASDPMAYVVLRVGAMRHISGAKFRRWAGLLDLATATHVATWEDGVLTITVDDAVGDP